MTESTYERELRLFEEALDLAEGPEREAFLDSECGDDHALRDSLAKLIAAEHDAGAFFADSSRTLVELVSADPVDAPEASNNPAVGTKIGPYEIVELIGEGGGGSVFVAEQKQPIRRRVALKIIRIGMDTKSVIARFEAERQALALMDHSNIAHVLDAGTTTTGLPFFVMELVDGPNIIEYCDENRLSIPERLSLFVKVCHAILHAHQKGLIHRDIKPSNILITIQDGQPAPKIIDFGIVKATDVPLTEDEGLTQHIQMIGTPAYMSPEQAERGPGIDTRSDIYSLGALFYEVLTGRPPFEPGELTGSGLRELLRILREVDPPAASHKLENLPPEELGALAGKRGTDAAGLITAVRGDLDWIASKSMEKDPARRYVSADGMAEDIKRHLAYEPVGARPPTRRYLLQKLIRRNRLVFGFAAGMAAVLVLGSVVSTRLYLREREARKRLGEARQTQILLREEADRRRDQAEELRQLAEAREAITQAVVLLRDGDFAAADALVDGVPVIQPTPEGADVFRRLGDWHEEEGRFKQAAERFSYLIEVNFRDANDNPTLDHLRTGPILIESGDLEEFDRFRRTMIERFANEPDAITAERVVKVALLLPADEPLMRKLDAFIDVSVNSLEGFDQRVAEGILDDFELWRMTSVAQGEYRRGRFQDAEYWSRKCLEHSRNEGPREAHARVLLALAVYRQGYADEARLLLDSTADLIKSKCVQGQELVRETDGWWADWLIARILLREAEELTDEASR